jgi:OOP family OmpA-OmpF porin
MKLKSSLAVLLAGVMMIFSSGCASKKFVRQQTQPLIDKSNDLDALTAKTTNTIRDVDARATTGIQGVNDKTLAADQKATDARSRADEAQTMASQANSRVDTLTNQVANLDNYRPVVETTVHFAFDKANLTEKAKSTLDQLIADVPNTKGYLVVVEGGTDSVGNASYNYGLSERRAEAVVQYLSGKNIPPHKIYLVGLGKDKTVASNQSASGRAQNRRVEVRLMTNVLGQEAPTSAQNAAPNPSR